MTRVLKDALAEWLHTRWWVGLGTIALLQWLLASVAGPASLGFQARGTAAVGVWVIELAGLLGAAAIGSRAIGGALEKGSAQLALAGDLSRGSWVLGRALGAAAVTGAWAASLILVWLPVAWSWGLAGVGCLWALVGLTFKLWLITAWAMLLGSVARAPASHLACFALVFAGLFADEVLLYSASHPPLSRWLIHGLYLVVPDLDLFDIHGMILGTSTLSAGSLAISGVYACTAGILLGWLTSRVIRDKDLA